MTLLSSFFHVYVRAVMLILLSVWVLCMLAADTRSCGLRFGEETAFAGEYSFQQHSDSETDAGERQQEISIPTRKFKPRSTPPNTMKQESMPVSAGYRPVMHADSEEAHVKQLLTSIERGHSLLRMHELQFQHSEREQKIYSMNDIA